MLAIFQFSQIHKSNYKKNLVQHYMPKKKKENRIFFIFFEKILAQMQGRKLTTLGVFKLKRNTQKQG